MVSETLNELYKKHGKLTPEIVVEEARNEDSPLHSHFDWDNKEAGEKWRLHQARMLICRVKVVSETSPDEKTRVFVHNGKKDKDRAYNHVDVVVNDPGELIRTLDRFRDDVLAYVERIRNLGEYKQHSERAEQEIKAIEKALSNLVSLYQLKQEQEEAA